MVEVASELDGFWFLYDRGCFWTGNYITSIRSKVNLQQWFGVHIAGFSKHFVVDIFQVADFRLLFQRFFELHTVSNSAGDNRTGEPKHIIAHSHSIIANLIPDMI